MLCLLLLSAVLAGCASRPGPEVLVPVQAAVPGARLVTVYVATTRERAQPDENVFTSDRAPAMRYAEFTISVPPNHQPGRIEYPDGRPDPALNFVTVRQTILDRQTFESRIAARGGRREGVGVFVHGFNYNFQESLFRMAQMAADVHVTGVPILFAWPSAASVTGYIADKDAAAYSRDGLAALMMQLTTVRSGEPVSVVAHSMGGWLTMESLRQLRLTGRSQTLDRLNVTLASPDIDVDVFRAQMTVIGRMRNPITVLVSPDDQALSLSGRIAGARPRLGTLDVNDPRLQAAAVQANLRFIDVTTVQASDGFKHDRFINLAALHPSLMLPGRSPDGNIRQAGAFIFDAIGTTLASPFSIAGRAIRGE